MRSGSRVDLALLGAMFLASCAKEMVMPRPHESVRVCFQKNDVLSVEENDLFETELEKAVRKPRSYRTIWSCDSGDTTPRLRFKPLAFDYASLGERIAKPLITVASVGSALYFGYFVVVFPLPEVEASYEIRSEAGVSSADRREFRSTSLSFAGGPSRQREQISRSLEEDLAQRLRHLMPSAP